MRYFSVTRRGHPGKKNEDRSLIKEFSNGSLLLAVADGMGGHAGGDLAAHIAVDTLNHFNPEFERIEVNLVELMLTAKRKISERANEDSALAGMGTTLTTVFIGDSVAYWAHVGDSRLYLFREAMLVQVTEDHTVPALLQSAGEITGREASAHPLRNVLVSCIGTGGMEVDTGSLALNKGDLLILSTDGLHDVLPEEQMESILRSEIDLNKRLNALIDASLAAGGKDDMTAAAAEV
jgi:serine/threonine protein phosphatase PrpC